jgi:signal transduction histidine kinase
VTIHWGAEDFPTNPTIDAAIRDALLSRSAAPVDYYAEYLESETLPPENAAVALRDYIRHKFEGRRIDLVITTATPALQFAIRHREELFPDIPIVFAAGVAPDVMGDRAFPRVTGVVSDPGFGETLDLALRLHPSVRHVFVVAQAPTVESYDERVRSALRPFAQRVELTYIREPSISDLLSRIRAIPAESLILYTRYAPSDAENIVHTDAVVRLMAEVSPVPIYGTTDVYIDTGVVGGMMRGTRATGTRIGEIARQILDGAPPENIPVGVAPLVPTFDWRQVQRWGIDPSRLPPGSDIRFRVPTTWETYRGYIIGTVIVVGVQLLLIAGLLAQRARRQRAEDTIRAREVMLRTSYDRIRHMAGRLINAQEAARASMARDLHDDVCQRLVCVSMTVKGLQRLSGDIQDGDAQQAFAQLERETTDMFDGIRRLAHELHPANLSLLGLGPTLKAHCNEVASRHSVQVKFETAGELGHVPGNVALCFFRIGQEALRNGVVHGKAQRFLVSLIRTGEVIELTITDDGGGFDLEAVRGDASTGLGLVSMEERAHAIGAEVHIVSGPRQGTTVRVRSASGDTERANRVKRHSWHDSAHRPRTAHKRGRTPIST